MKHLENFSNTTIKSDFQIELSELVSEAASIEEFIYLALKNYFQLQMTRFKEGDSPDIMMVEVKQRRCALKKRKDESTVVAIPMSQIKKPAGYKALDETVHQFSDKEGVLVDSTWWDKRDSRLRIREDKWNPELFMAPPGSLRELILSYLNSSVGLVSIKRDLAHIKAGVRDVAVLELVSLRNLNSEGPYFREALHVELGKLKKLVEKRKAIREAE